MSSIYLHSNAGRHDSHVGLRLGVVALAALVLLLLSSVFAAMPPPDRLGNVDAVGPGRRPIVEIVDPGGTEPGVIIFQIEMDQTGAPRAPFSTHRGPQ